MGQKKLIRFEAIKSFPNVLQYPENTAGRWDTFFGNQHPITLELGCGKGEYTVQLAQIHPNRNFIGVDLKGNRLYVGAKKCLQENITNTAFLRTHIDKIDTYFNTGEIAEIWITFPDPHLRKSKAKKRLTHPRFLRLYHRVLVRGGCIHLKTDSPELYDFTKLVIELYGLILHEDYSDVHAGQSNKSELNIQTYYEGLDISRSNKIHYLKFSLPLSPLPDLDNVLQERIREYEQETT